MGKLYLTTGDYIKNAKGMDAIVDAQNKYMGVGGNVCGLILSAAGKEELLNYCKEHYKENMYPSEVRVTPGFNLNMDIIHALSPIYHEHDEPIEMLKKTYENLVQTIKDKKYKKVMICSLGTGSYGYKHSDVAQDVIKILYNFAKDNDVELYFNNMYPIYKDVYLREYLIQNNIEPDSIYNYSDEDLKDLFEKYSLYDLNIEEKYKDFVDGKPFDELYLSEYLIYKQYELAIR